MLEKIFMARFILKLVFLGFESNMSYRKFKMVYAIGLTKYFVLRALLGVFSN